MKSHIYIRESGGIEVALEVDWRVPRWKQGQEVGNKVALELKLIME